METPCPVTRAYVCALGRLIDFKLYINDAYLDQYEALSGRSRRLDATLDCTRLRAFLCVEYMDVALRGRQLKPWPRSREGLDELINTLKTQREELMGDLMEAKVERTYAHTYDQETRLMIEAGKGRDGVSLRRVEQYRIAEEAAVVLRRALKNSSVPLSRVGKRLALFTTYLGLSTQDRIKLGEYLLGQSEDWAARAWEAIRTW